MKINIHNSKILIANESAFDNFFSKVEAVKQPVPSHEVIICGDFNLANIQWTNLPLGFQPLSYIIPPVSRCAQRTLETCSFLGASQLFPAYPSKNYTLDLFTTYPDVCILDTQEPIVKVDPHHPPVWFSLNIADSCNHSHATIQGRRRYNFYNCDYTRINMLLLDVDWERELTCDNVDGNVEKLQEVLHRIISCNVPLSREPPSHRPPWYNSEIKNLIQDKKLAHIKWKRSNSLDDYIRFKELRARCIRTSRRCYNSFVTHTEANIKQNPKSFWTFINKLRSDNAVPSNMYHSDIQANDDVSIANLFLSYFGSVYSTLDLEDIPLVNGNALLEFLEITPQDIFSAVGDLDNNGNPGPDGIPAYFIKNCLPSLQFPILRIYNESLAAGIFPATWKQAFVMPIHKSGDKHNISNYRPISILSTLAKLLDCIVSYKLAEFIGEQIERQQHGFLKGRSTLTNLLLFNNFVMISLEDHTQVDAIYIDYSKAFYSVNRKQLLQKLRNAGIRGRLLSWIGSYLKNRTQSVRFRDCISNSITTTSGVPQGSHIGPLLFIIFINDAVDILKSSTALIYADDLKIFRHIRSPLDASLLQRDHDSLLELSVSNRLSMNFGKCKAMSYHRRPQSLLFTYALEATPVPRVTEIRDLGVLYSTSLSFTEHIYHVTAKALRMLGFIRRSTIDFRDSIKLMVLYKRSFYLISPTPLSYGLRTSINTSSR